jgi:hypothetical protein
MCAVILLASLLWVLIPGVGHFLAIAVLVWGAVAIIVSD